MNTLPSSEIPTETVKRITNAADQLFEENGRSAIPNVDAVRRKARVNMNDASNVMRAWRRAQTASDAPLTTSIPAAVQEASHSMLAAVWHAATTSANTALQTAQAGWEQERAEAEACRHQLAVAFDTQTEELATAQRNIEAIEQQLTVQKGESLGAAASIESLRQELAKTEGLVAIAEIRSIEISKRADDLKAELNRTLTGADRERLDLQSRLDVAESTITHLQSELRQTSEREIAVREQLAHLRGQVDAIETKRQDLVTTMPTNGERRKKSALPATVTGALESRR